MTLLPVRIVPPLKCKGVLRLISFGWEEKEKK